MKRFRTSVVLLACIAFVAAAAAAAPAQSGQEVATTQLHAKPIRKSALPVMPFPADAPRVQPVEVRTAEQMSLRDRAAVTDAESSIREQAGISGLEFDAGGLNQGWSYRQIVCPALPQHIFLKFSRNNGAGDLSLFTASIPAGGKGRVRVIPIQRRGYSLFSPAPINALTIAAFNRIRAEEGADAAPGWLGTGLCYAALAGALPQLMTLADDPAKQRFPTAMGAGMEIPEGGGAVIHFADQSTERPMLWTMSFNAKGKLLKAQHAPAELLTEKPVAANSVTARRVPQ